MKTGFFREHTGKTCARRILGTMGFASCIVAVFAQIQHPLLEHLLVASTALIGSTAVDMFSTPAMHKRDGGENV